MTARMTDSADIIYFLTGKKPTFTIVSVATGNRKTYRMERTEHQRESWFVSALTGSDNEHDYTYMGMLFNNNDAYVYALTKASPTSSNFHDAFDWFIKQVQVGDTLTEAVEFWHEGSCCMCGRKLTTPESVKRGIGPVCATKI